MYNFLEYIIDLQIMLFREPQPQPTLAILSTTVPVQRRGCLIHPGTLVITPTTLTACTSSLDPQESMSESPL